MFQFRLAVAFAVTLLLASCGGSESDSVPQIPVRGGDAWDLPEQAPERPQTIASVAPALADVTQGGSHIHGAIPALILTNANLFMASEAFDLGRSYAERIDIAGLYGGNLHLEYRSSSAGSGYATLDFRDYKPAADVVMSGRIVVEVVTVGGNQWFRQVTSYHDYRENYTDGYLAVSGTVTQPGRLDEVELDLCCDFPSQQTADLDLKIDTGAASGSLYLIDVAVAASDSEYVDMEVGYSSSVPAYRRQVTIEGEVATDREGRFAINTIRPIESIEARNYTVGQTYDPTYPVLVRTDTLLLEGAEVSGSGPAVATFSWLNPYFHTIDYDTDGDHRVDSTARIEMVEGRVDTGALIGLQHVMADGRFGAVRRRNDYFEYAIGESIVLDGRMSVSPHGTALTYRWTLVQKPAGSNAIIYDDVFPQAWFVPDVIGRYLVRLEVNDGVETDAIIYPYDVLTVISAGSSESVHSQRTRVADNGDAVIDYRVRPVPVEKGASIAIIGDRMDNLWPQDTVFESESGGPDRVSGSVDADGKIYQSTGAGEAPRFSAPVLIDTGLPPGNNISFRQFGDFNGDGRLDLGTIAWDSELKRSRIHVKLRLRDGGFSDGGILDIGDRIGFEFADMDSDGRTDLVVYDYKAVHILWRDEVGVFAVERKTSLEVPTYVFHGLSEGFRIATERGNSRPSLFFGRTGSDGIVTISVISPTGVRDFQPVTETQVSIATSTFREGAFFSDIEGDGDLDWVQVVRRHSLSADNRYYDEFGLSFAIANDAGYSSSAEVVWLPRKTDVGFHVREWNDGNSAEGDYPVMLQTLSYKKINDTMGWSGDHELYDVEEDSLATEAARDETMLVVTVVPEFPGSSGSLPLFCLPTNGLSAFGPHIYGSYPCPSQAEKMIQRSFTEDVDGNGWDDILLANGAGYFVIFRSAPLSNTAESP